MTTHNQFEGISMVCGAIMATSHNPYIAFGGVVLAVLSAYSFNLKE